MGEKKTYLRLSGKGTLIVDGKRVKVKKGDYIKCYPEDIPEEFMDVFQEQVTATRRTKPGSNKATKQSVEEKEYKIVGSRGWYDVMDANNRKMNKYKLHGREAAIDYVEALGGKVLDTK